MNNLSDNEANSGTELLTLMGQVLATWQGVEHVVADIYLIFFRPARVDPASVAFHAIKTWDMRLGVVSALIKFFCSDLQKKAWGDHLGRIRKCSGSRNAVAHGLVNLHGPVGQREFVIGESPYNIADFPDNVVTRNGFHTRKELKEMCISFLTLTKTLDSFREELANDQTLRNALNTPNSKVMQHEASYPLRAALPPMQ